MSYVDPRSDQSLVHAANRGDPAAFQALYLRYRDWVVALAFRFTRNHDDALDVIQDAFAYLLRKFPNFRLTSSMKTFLYPVVRNLSLTALRRRSPALSGDALLDLPAPAPSSPDLSPDLQAVLASLSPPHREILLMRFVDDMDLADIAASLGVPLGTVKSRLHLALTALRDDPRTRSYFLE